MTDEQKLKAVETYLDWCTDTYDDAMKVLNHIWYVVVEGRYLDIEDRNDDSAKNEVEID